MPLLLVSAACFAAPRTVEQEPEQVVASHADASEFFRNLKQFCGKRFAGKATFTPAPDDPMATAKLVMHVAECKDNEIRIPFHVDKDRSRTWIIRWTERDGLQFKHDHRHEDGTPDKLTDYGGWAAPFGTAWKQSFPADEHTKKLVPAAATNVWTLEVEHDGGLPMRFVYDLKRDDKPRFRAEFDLTKPLP